MTRSIEPARALGRMLAAVLLGAGLVAASGLARTASALPLVGLSPTSTQVGIDEELRLGDDGTPKAHTALARSWIGVVRDVLPGISEGGKLKVEAAVTRLREAGGRDPALRREVREAKRVARDVTSFASHVRNLDSFVVLASGATRDDRFLTALTLAAKRATRVEITGLKETHVAWSHLISALDDAVLTLVERVDEDQARLTAVAGAADTKPGKRALALLNLVDRLAERGLADRAQIELLDAEPIAYSFGSKPVKEERAIVKSLKREVVAYGGFAKALERIQRKLAELVDKAIEKAGGEEPGEKCPLTFELPSLSGGGVIDLQIESGSSRRYPVLMRFDSRPDLGVVVVSAWTDGGPHDGDFFSIVIRDPQLSVGSYSFERDEDPPGTGLALFVFDTRGPDGDPFTENNHSFFDYERDVLSGSVTIEKVDLTKDGREVSGTFTVETAFLDNPEEHRAEATITGSFHCCRFGIVLADGSFDLPE